MTLSGEAKFPRPVDEWDPGWLAPESFRIPVERVIDLSVGPAEEFELQSSRWNAGVRVGLPDWILPEDELALSNFVDAHLRGRNPASGTIDGDLFVNFKVLDGSRASLELAEDFAESLASDDVFGAAAYRGMATCVVWADLGERLREFNSDS
jgi:hypothetical protein